ncbi:hypothetical protein BGZ57DRAFT_955649 [Hyaloscypha finlandica]|nr:hypothetical protein BGZ57DRAFT_955649 [Hyaloscypha finlandica]
MAALNRLSALCFWDLSIDIVIFVLLLALPSVADISIPDPPDWLNEGICSAACATPVHNREYLNWLYATCIGISSGYGTANSPSIDTLTIGSTTTSYKPGLSNAESSYDIEPTYKIPTCVDRSESCQSNYVAAWTNCIVNSSEIYLANQGEDLIPWHWNLSWSPPSQKSGTSTKRAAETPARPHCPSTGAKLGAFAAVNNAMAIIMSILGRRSVIFFVIFGLLGKPDMLLWWISGILTLCLHVLSNAVNAILIQRTPGFASVNVGQLILLWCTRPRLAWMVMLYLMPLDAEQTIMGSAVTFARQQKLFNNGVLSHAQGGHDAITMYAGALMWLACFIFAIGACSWTVLGVNTYLLRLGRSFNGLAVKARKHRDGCRTLLSKNSFAAESLGSLEKNLSVLCLQPFQDHNSLRQAVTQFARKKSGNRYKEVTDYDTRYYENGHSSSRSRRSRAKSDLSLKLPTFRDNTQRVYDTATSARAAEAIALNDLRGQLVHAKTQLRNLELQILPTTAAQLRHPIRAARRFFTSMTKIDIETLIRSCEANASVIAGWDATISEWSWTLRKWDHLIEEREKERSRADIADPETRTLRTLTKWTFFGMLGCWIAQWVYCPPNLPAIAAIWTLFSAAGAASGASV